MQVPYQLLSVVVASIWAFILTFLILQVIGIIPIMRLKLSALEEEMYIFILF
jgi:ammonium transporter, Amt family